MKLLIMSRGACDRKGIELIGLTTKDDSGA